MYVLSSLFYFILLFKNSPFIVAPNKSLLLFSYHQNYIYKLIILWRLIILNINLKLWNYYQKTMSFKMGIEVLEVYDKKKTRKRRYNKSKGTKDDALPLKSISWIKYRDWNLTEDCKYYKVTVCRIECSSIGPFQSNSSTNFLPPKIINF